MTGNLHAVKQDDRNVQPIAGFEFGIAGDVHHFALDPATLDDLLGTVAQMATGLGIDGDSMHERNLTTKTQRRQNKNLLFFVPWCLGGESPARPASTGNAPACTGLRRGCRGSRLVSS